MAQIALMIRVNNNHMKNKNVYIKNKNDINIVDMQKKHSSAMKQGDVYVILTDNINESSIWWLKYI